jgi:hypothetical protein
MTTYTTQAAKDAAVAAAKLALDEATLVKAIRQFALNDAAGKADSAFKIANDTRHSYEDALTAADNAKAKSTEAAQARVEADNQLVAARSYYNSVFAAYTNVVGKGDDPLMLFTLSLASNSLNNADKAATAAATNAASAAQALEEANATKLQTWLDAQDAADASSELQIKLEAAQTADTQAGNERNAAQAAYNDAINASILCFLAGTLIATPDGERPIESLQPGDLISTAEGPQPVRFLARSTRSIAQLQALDKMPIRINQGALGCLGPAQDTFMSPSHAIHFAGCLVEAGALINDTSIQQLNDWPDAALTYYNIELERHGLITANNLLVESYFANYRSNGFSRDCWDNYHDYVALYGAGELMEELPLPRIPFARQIPMQLRQSLQLHEDNYISTKPGISTSGANQLAGLLL